MPDVVDAPITEQEFDQISNLVYQHCGINLHKGKQELVHARIAKQLHRKRLNSFADYMRLIQHDPTRKEFLAFIDAITTNLTSFFREPMHYTFLRETLLPAILDRQPTTPSLRAWSAGCSSGEEPYSIAMTINEVLNGRIASDVKILATDLSNRMLTLGETGVYAKSRMHEVPPHLRAKYFKPFGGQGDAYKVNQDVRNLVSYRYLNLIQPWPFKGNFDFIFCRNVMIYFDKSTQQKLVTDLYDRLRPGGYLFTGHSESLSGLDHPFRYVQPTIYLRTP
ncbi:protein-glutamate O-methyltransferase [soil metagenome]